MFKLVSKILTLGIKPGMTDEEQIDYRINNTLAVFILSITIPFIFIGFALLPYFIGVLITIVAGVYVSILFLNSRNRIHISNLIFSFLPAAVLSIVHLYMIRPDEAKEPAQFFIQLGVAQFGWVVNKWENKGVIFLSGIWNAGLLFMVYMLPGMNDYGFETPYFIFAYLYPFMIILGFAILAYCFYCVNLGNVLNVRKNSRLLEENSKKNASLEENAQEMKASMAALKEAQEEDKNRQWVNDGLNQVNDILRSAAGRSDTLDDLMKSIVRLTGSVMGGLYFIREEEKALELMACYAFDRKKYLSKKVSFGEGLVGQCYLEQEPTYLTEIPENYFEITSGLGDAPPRSLLIYPLLVNEQVVGVIELGSFKAFSDREFAFVNQLSGIVGGYWNSLQTTEKMSGLLEESQRQAQDLKDQEQQMRIQMEEWEAEQENLRREVKELRAALALENA
ncbi:GAF domain-containing protein [Persicobacter diffluens]